MILTQAVLAFSRMADLARLVRANSYRVSLLHYPMQMDSPKNPPRLSAGDQLSSTTSPRAARRARSRALTDSTRFTSRCMT